MKAARPQGHTNLNVFLLHFHYGFHFQGSMYRKHYLSVYVSLRSVRISFPLLWIFKLLFNSSAPALFFLRFFYFVYMSLTTSSLSPFMAIYCRSDRFGEARSWLFAISFLLLFFFVRWLTYLALASCKINAIYYILPKPQVQVCVYAFTIPLELTVRERWIIGGNIN